MSELPCFECELLWAKYVYIREELVKKLLAVEVSGDRLGLEDLEDSRALVREAFREHALAHSEEAVLVG